MSSSQHPHGKHARWLQDILDNAESIFGYTKGMDLVDFEENRLVYDAVERCMQRLTEAVIRLGDHGPILMPDQPWHRIRGFGNRLRHNYDNIEEDQLFDIVRNQLPSLCASAKAALAKLEQSDKTP